MISRLRRILVKNRLQDIPYRLLRSFRHHALHQPDYMLLQCISACNLKCEHCFINDYGKSIPDGKIKVLPLAEVERRLDILAPTIRKLGALGFSSFESLLHKDFFRMMDAALRINPRLSFPLLTNGQLVTPDIVKKLESYPLSTITISLDGLYPETVEAFKTGSQFAKTIHAIEMFLASRHSHLVEVIFVAHRHNIEELPDYLRFVHSLGVQKVSVSNLLTFRENLQDRVLYGKSENTHYREILNKAQKIAQELHIDLGLPRLTPANKGCTQSEFIFIGIDGDVSPCDFLAVQTPFYLWGERKQNAPLLFGNAFQSDLAKIWSSSQAKQFREDHRKGKIPDACSHCIDAYGLMCSNRDNA